MHGHIARLEAPGYSLVLHPKNGSRNRDAVRGERDSRKLRGFRPAAREHDPSFPVLHERNRQPFEDQLAPPELKVQEGRKTKLSADLFELQHPVIPARRSDRDIAELETITRYMWVMPSCGRRHP